MNKILIDLTTARQVLEALNSFPHRHLTPFISDTRTALREALAEQPAQQEPVACVSSESFTGQPITVSDIITCSLPVGTELYTSPPQRKPLMDEKIDAIWDAVITPSNHIREFVRAIEAAHGIKENT